MNIVLYEPEMPANTGNIGRTCVATNTRLHLIEPLGFKLSEKHLVRAGLDYWDKLDVTVYSDFADFLKRNPGAKLYMATTIRSLNLSNSVAVLLYEALRQNGFEKMTMEGHLHRLEWKE